MSFAEFLKEAMLDRDEREKLSPTQFGLPKEKKFPLEDAAHVRSAIARFHFCKESSRTELARNIRKAARKFKVEISPDALVSRY